MQKINSRLAELESSAWMNRPPHPMPVFSYQDLVYVLRNGSWHKSKVITSSKNGCQVQLIDAKEAFNLYDARCIRPA